jgi:polyphosphate kinase 2 (PPK2 family)
MPKLSDIEKHPELQDKNEYEERLSRYQLRLLRLQQTLFQKQRRAMIAFEGWDAAGKGGAIRRISEKLDPRGCHVWPISAPNGDEQGRHYLWRFWQRVPAPGEIAIFDRTWYGRVLVERVEKFATKMEWRRAYDEINQFEKMLADDGCPVIKIFLHISKKEQLKRFEEREKNPYKHWKITDDDWRNRKKWKQYEKAIDEMFERTDTGTSPWVLIGANHKWYARSETLKTVVETLEEWW